MSKLLILMKTICSFFSLPRIFLHRITKLVCWRKDNCKIIVTTTVYAYLWISNPLRMSMWLDAWINNEFLVELNFVLLHSSLKICCCLWLVRKISSVSFLLGWHVLRWMRYQTLEHLWDLLPLSETGFQVTRMRHFHRNQGGIISMYHMLALGLPGALLTWISKDLTKPSVSRLVSSLRAECFSTGKNTCLVHYAISFPACSMNRQSNPSLKELKNQTSIRAGFFLIQKQRSLELNLIGWMEQRVLGSFMKLQVLTTRESTQFLYGDTILCLLSWFLWFALLGKLFLLPTDESWSA